MKKTISLSIFFVALLSTIISIYSINTTTNIENSLLLANIEALTNSSEGGSSGVVGHTPQVEMGGAVSFQFKTIHCCKYNNPGTHCNKDGNDNECGYLKLDK